LETKEYQKAYFALRDYVYKNGNTGYTHLELHQLSKQHILPMLADEDDCWEGGVSMNSTKNLTTKGWHQFIEQFKVFCLDNFNISIL